MEQNHGMVAILDALGAARYGDLEIASFLESRERVLNILQKKADVKETRGEIEVSAVSTFTFNDTVLIVFRTPSQPTSADVEHFGLLLRKFAVDSLAQGILFRGSIALGTFYVDDDSNTVMGSAVTDAAAWYDKAEWIGISATPHASMVIEALIENSGRDLNRVFIDYQVPFKDGSSQVLKAVNWPKGFYVRGVRPVRNHENERAKCLELLSNHGVPKGAERKHANTMSFFDHCVELWKKEQKNKS